ncbi:hypothetical protein [Vibrio sp. TBV020]|uniref:hypothetical protein n=1 Tax=Vibrio sp. TBV020 TaxID=3137398 RepID=UPI0038CD1E94
MSNNDIEALIGFLELLDAQSSLEHSHILNQECNCIRVSLANENNHFLIATGIELFWNSTWLSLDLYVENFNLKSNTHQSLLGPSPYHTQCAIDKKGCLHLISKLKRHEVRKEELYQRYIFMTDRLRMVIENE